MHNPDLREKQSKAESTQWLKITITAGKEVVREVGIEYLQHLDPARRTEMILGKVQAMLRELPEINCPSTPESPRARPPRAGDVRWCYSTQGLPFLQQWRVDDRGVGQWMTVEDVYEGDNQP